MGIAKEAVRGTPLTPSFWIPKTDASVEDATEFATDEPSVNRI